EPPGGLVPRRVARRPAVRRHGQLRHRVVDRDRARHLRGAREPARARDADPARARGGGGDVMRSHPKGVWPSGLAPPAGAGEHGVRPEGQAPRRRLGLWAAYALGALALALAFASYLSPDMAFTLMTQAWSCL